MSNDASDAFLSGAGIPVAPGEIDEVLAQLWGPAAEREGGPDLDHPTVTRVVLANLVVADLVEAESRVLPLLPFVARRYPCRLILLHTSTSAERRVEAEVSAICHLPAPGMPQVCSECIVLKAGRPALDLLPGSVRPILESDLPLVLWWAGDPRRAELVFRELAEESTRLIIDLPDPEAEPAAVRLALDLKLNLFDRDIAWFGITPWRELVAQFFDPPGSKAILDQIRSVKVRAKASKDGRPPRVALWLVGWLAGQLGWRDVQCQAGERGRFQATFRGRAASVEVVVETEADPSQQLPQIVSVDLDAGDQGSFRVERLGETSEVRAIAKSGHHSAMPRVLRSPEWDATRRLAAALESARDDPPYRSALPHVLWMIERS